MKYKIISLDEKTTTTGKQYKRMTLRGPEGDDTAGVTIWSDFPEFATFATDGEIEGDIVVKGDFKNLYAPKKSGGGRPNMDRVMEVSKNNKIEVQKVISESVARAQDRTAWMWAKNNACELYAQDRIGTKLDTEEQALSKILSFATKIYNGEPTEPF